MEIKVNEHIVNGMERVWHLNEVLYRENTPYQEIIIGNTFQGISMFCNNERQSTELTQQIYHEGQIFPAVLLAKEIKDVLIIGSSEGVVSQMALSCGAENIEHVDIDLKCVQICAQLLPYGYNLSDLQEALKAKGIIKLIINDGFDYVHEAINNGKLYDIIVMDLPDESAENEEQQNRLYDSKFLSKLTNLLKPEGAFITQAGNSAYWRNNSLRKAWQKMNSIFPTSVYFEIEEQDWSWIVGCNFKCDNPIERMQKKINELKVKPKFIDNLSIVKSTILPISIRQGL